MPAESPHHHARFETLIDAIRGYLATHPAAADTVEGIAGWAVGAVASVTADEVRSALSHLEARGEVAKREVPGGPEVFARTDASRASQDTLRIGVDVGGTKTEIIAFDPDGRERLRRREPTPRDDYDAMLALVTRLVAEGETACGVAAGSARVGIGTPGSLSRATGLLRGSNSTYMNGMPVKRDLETRLGRSVALANDANCFALSEATDGAGRGANIVFGVILGTGVGGGIVVRGRVIEGRNAIGGEWDTIHCRGRTTRNVPALHAFAGSTAASRRGCPVRDSRATTASAPQAASRCPRRRSSRAPHGMTLRAMARSSVTRTVLRGRSLTS